MATLPSYFSDYLTDVRPTKNQRDDLKQGHKTLRKRLCEDVKLAPIIVSDFLQGSYRRSTVVRPKGDKRSDVDIIVVTCMDKDEYTPSEAMEAFVPFLDKHYKGKWRPQGRSFGIELSYVEMDLVITAAPSESMAGILGEKSVTTDDSLTEALDWRLVKGWIPPEERVTFSDSMRLEKALSQPEWKNRTALDSGSGGRGMGRNRSACTDQMDPQQKQPVQQFLSGNRSGSQVVASRLRIS